MTESERRQMILEALNGVIEYLDNDKLDCLTTYAAYLGIRDLPQCSGANVIITLNEMRLDRQPKRH